MATVDTHQHFLFPERFDYPWITDAYAALRSRFGPEELASELVTTGVEATVLVQTLTTTDETRYLLGVAERCKFVVGVVGWVDLTRADVADELEALRSGAGGEWLVGVRHPAQDEADPEWLLRSDVATGLGAVFDAGLVYDLLVRPSQIAAAVEVSRRFPQGRFVVDHLAKPPIAARSVGGWAEAMSPFADLTNVCCKLSGLVTEARWDKWSVSDLRPFVERALEWFGAERVMFGSDWPVCTVAAAYAEVFDATDALLASLDAVSRAAVFGDTARRVYHVLER